jgi:hypothetical protein
VTTASKISNCHPEGGQSAGMNNTQKKKEVQMKRLTDHQHCCDDGVVPIMGADEPI